MPDYRAKLSRANEHLDALDKVVKAFIQEEPYRTITKLDSQTGKYREYSVRLKHMRAAPQPLSLLVGDALFNLRSSLDHVVYAIAARHDPSALDRTEFPIFLDQTRYAAASPQKIGALPPKAQAAIERAQPYHSTNPGRHPLWLLHDLNRVDKHRLLHVVQTVSSRSDLILEYPDGRFIGIIAAEAPAGGFKNGAVILRYRLRPTDPQMDVKPQLACEVCFGPGPAEGLPLVHTLSEIRDRVWLTLGYRPVDTGDTIRPGV